MREFRANLPDYLRQVQQGRSILIAVRDNVIAEVRATAIAPSPRITGALKGHIQIAPDFDELTLNSVPKPTPSYKTLPTSLSSAWNQCGKWL